MSAKPALYDRLSGLDNLRYAAELYGLGRGDAGRRAASSRRRERFGIDGALDQQVGGYSTGMKTRLALARSVLHQPDLLLYDEPTSGLDPESSYAVLELIREMTDDGNTVIMCTHLLLEAEGLADQVVMLQDGPLAGAGPSRRARPALLARGDGAGRRRGSRRRPRRSSTNLASSTSAPPTTARRPSWSTTCRACPTWCSPSPAAAPG